MPRGKSDWPRATWADFWSAVRLGGVCVVAGGDRVGGRKGGLAEVLVSNGRVRVRSIEVERE